MLTRPGGSLAEEKKLIPDSYAFAKEKTRPKLIERERAEQAGTPPLQALVRLCLVQVHASE